MPFTITEFNLIPPCLRTPLADGLTLTGCLFEALFYWVNMLFVLTAIVTFLMIIYAGYQMVTAFGNEAQFTQGKKTLQYAIIGFIIAISARLIVSVFQLILRGEIAF